MKQRVLSSAVCLITSLLCTQALAGEQVDETLDAAADGYVEVEHMNGKATIIGWDRDEVQVKGELGERTEEFIFRRDGNEILIKVETERNRDHWNWSSSDGDKLEIFVPQNSRLNYNSTNADVSVEKLFGGVDIDVVNGEVKVEELAGRIRLESVNGDIESRNLTGNISIETVNGDIEDRNASGTAMVYETVNGNIDVATDAEEVRAETVNGDIELELGQLKELDMNTVNGTIDAKMHLLRQGDVRANSVGGSVSLYFQKDVSARFDVEGHAGGRIINRLSDHAPSKAKYGPRRWLEFSLNGGDARVDVSTVSGRIKLAYQ